MEIMRRHMAKQPTALAAYLALQSALMRRFLARGGTVEEFCERLAPTFHRRYAAVLHGDGAPGIGQTHPRGRAEVRAAP